MLWRKPKSEGTGASTTATGGGKGRPTPTRKEAEAAAKARARGTASGTSKQQRAQRAAMGARARQGMRNGEEKYLPERDKGPVRRFIRDWLDSRLSFLEFLLPALILVMVLSLSSTRSIQTVGNTLYSILWLLVIIDVAWMFLRLSGELKRRFPEHDTRGWRFYSLMRCMQLRPLRIPKPQVKLFQSLPDTYR